MTMGAIFWILLFIGIVYFVSKKGVAGGGCCGGQDHKIEGNNHCDTNVNESDHTLHKR